MFEAVFSELGLYPSRLPVTSNLAFQEHDVVPEWVQSFIVQIP
jgi:hypothetical protein